MKMKNLKVQTVEVASGVTASVVWGRKFKLDMKYLECVDGYHDFGGLNVTILDSTTSGDSIALVEQGHYDKHVVVRFQEEATDRPNNLSLAMVKLGILPEGYTSHFRSHQESPDVWIVANYIFDKNGITVERASYETYTKQRDADDAIFWHTWRPVTDNFCSCCNAPVWYPDDNDEFESFMSDCMKDLSHCDLCGLVFLYKDMSIMSAVANICKKCNAPH